jgi:biotin synthase
MKTAAKNSAELESAARNCLAGGLIDREAARVLCRCDLFDLLYWANRIRQKFFGEAVGMCSIVSGRLGGCDQDCRFCSQSSRYKTHVTGTTVAEDEQILAAARAAAESGVRRFGIVYSGRTVAGAEFERLCGLVGRVRELGLHPCASAGMLDEDCLALLAGAGLEGYNHNLETSERYFPSVVTTHAYIDRAATIAAAKRAGLSVCAGGIFGMGETDSDRIEMAFTLRDLGVDTVPMNFLHPIEGTPLGTRKPLRPMEILRIIALYRFILPRTGLKVAGGRVSNLRDLQSWVFCAGANAILSGNYLTTAGRAVSEDMRMLRDLGLKPDAGLRPAEQVSRGSGEQVRKLGDM